MYTAVYRPCTQAVYTARKRPCTLSCTRVYGRAHSPHTAVYGLCKWAVSIVRIIRAEYTCIRPCTRPLTMAVYVHGLCTRPCMYTAHTRACTRSSHVYTACTRPCTCHEHGRVHDCIQAVYTDHCMSTLTVSMCTRPSRRPGHIMLDGDPVYPSQKRSTAPTPTIFGPCRLRPNAWID